jgi:hypothetical protein
LATKEICIICGDNVKGPFIIPCRFDNSKPMLFNADGRQAALVVTDT